MLTGYHLLCTSSARFQDLFPSAVLLRNLEQSFHAALPSAVQSCCKTRTFEPDSPLCVMQCSSTQINSRGQALSESES